jgi:hypothetical protein
MAPMVSRRRTHWHTYQALTSRSSTSRPGRRFATTPMVPERPPNVRCSRLTTPVVLMPALFRAGLVPGGAENFAGSGCCALPCCQSIGFRVLATTTGRFPAIRRLSGLTWPENGLSLGEGLVGRNPPDDASPAPDGPAIGRACCPSDVVDRRWCDIPRPATTRAPPGPGSPRDPTRSPPGATIAPRRIPPSPRSHAGFRPAPPTRSGRPPRRAAGVR